MWNSCLFPASILWNQAGFQGDLQLLLSPGVSEDACFPESFVPWVIFICPVGTCAVSQGSNVGNQSQKPGWFCHLTLPHVADSPFYYI